VVVGHFRGGEEGGCGREVDEVGEGVVEAGEGFEGVVPVAESGVVGARGLVVFGWLVGEEVHELLGEEGDVSSLVLGRSSVRRGSARGGWKGAHREFGSKTDEFLDLGPMGGFKIGE
jgi:hypothetical protein